MRDLVYYVAASVDGFIADEDGDASQFPMDPDTVAALFSRYPETCPAPLREAFGVTGERRRFDTVLLGRRTHQPAIEAGWQGGAYPHLRQIVVTHHDLGDTPGVETLSGDVALAVARLKAEPGDDIWLCGGADLASQLIDVIDELQVKVNPILLGGGIPLFARGRMPRSVALTEVDHLPGDVVLSTYRMSGGPGLDSELSSPVG
ncbi:dihydrofolate reductase family protein [Demequina muriae]|uniref:Dihydrofolate reductase family protein n=1 Tax=Demequina muriae TaxID=3051664 RepID=A0ABT8GG69_9MICO|nr:dihydrofolate reductase family protein [Demequina sp. EGI L300058]MDN4480422.1 dihydrofolate reductase family protein [Demequina sp. EGI L300058]